ncbi:MULTISPECIES: restriction endonuclease subunit S [Citrobacter]|uniref:restriction endonuclease subunit S n=1 Tax=Citrobacter TaxID=544 RepID=UPI0006BA6802|nr:MULTISPECIES: restriction endonuclease subunit S [Citrobacter]EKY0666208.1 restriction endonuclease subunit S [Citrobacter freundii]MDT7094235.1 restriction endonuclease subunit S [Citrobacter amalonaticus]QMD49680.1 restriction endonuclease subunit S [Citrobacter freundii]QMD59493.1 restriction endonuclease subunit S [Citrobacter freundii]UYF55048.1 restriction endonuclease subunit S [Citrobacter amalonaticus]
MSGGKLPEGWQTSSIGDLCKKVTDGSHNPPKASEIGLPMISAKNINNGSIIFSETHRIISEAEFWEENKRTNIESGDVLLTIVGTLGRTALVPQDFTPFTLQRSVAVLSTSELEPSYFRYALENRDFQIQIHENSKGTAQKGIYLNALKKLTINIAPKDEQKIIAEKLDTLLAQVDSTKARLEQILQILKRFRQAVLAAAVSGELTKHLTQTKKNEVTLDKIATIIDPHPSHRTPKIDDAGIPYIGIGDIQPDGKINFTSARKVSVDVFIEHRARYTLNEGDFIFGKIGTLGKACVLPIGFKYTLSANVILIQPIKDKVSSDYLRYFLSSPLTMQEITQQANSTSQAAFGIKKMRAFKCNLPSLVEQHEIVRRVEQLFAYADTIEKQVNSALTRVNNLTQSILAKAFRGELTAQWRAENPDLISGENSAAALLEKIKAERAASSGKKAARKKA